MLIIITGVWKKLEQKWVSLWPVQKDYTDKAEELQYKNSRNDILYKDPIKHTHT